MLLELIVEDFAVIEQARVSLGPGLNVITGETGAGKSLLVEALATVLGGRADREMLRVGASSARVEVVFRAHPKAVSPLAISLEEHGLATGEDGLLILAREIQRDGPNLCRINGRIVTMGVMREIGQYMVNIHGQGEHTALLNLEGQLELLDAFANLGSNRARVTDGIRQLRALEDELASMEMDERDVEQHRRLLVYQVEEIERAKLVPEEEGTLMRERELLTHAQTIQEACLKAHQALYGGTPSAIDLMAEAQAILDASPDPDDKLVVQREALVANMAIVEETARELRMYGEAAEAQPQRLAQIEERLDLIGQLRRKYGGTLEDVLALANQSQLELDQIGRGNVDKQRLGQALATTRKNVGVEAWELSLARHKASVRMDTAMAAELEDLNMGNVRFVVSLEHSPISGGLPAPDGQEYDFNERGIDRVEFRIATNPGEGLRPLARVASGGEVSRLMLALKATVHGNSGVPTLVFDEIDSGVGGRAGEVVGNKLWAVSHHHQVVCVTHLPQIAAFADRHFSVDKAVLMDRTFAQVQALNDDGRVRELTVMLGGASTPKATASAQELLRRAQTTKGNTRPVEEA